MEGTERNCIDWPALVEWMQPRMPEVSQGVVEGIRGPLGILNHEFASDYGQLV